MDDYEKLMSSFQNRRFNGYEVITIGLGTARNNELFSISGNLLYCEFATDSTSNVDVRFQNSDHSIITFTKDKKVATPFSRIFLTNSAQAGHTIKLVVAVKEFFNIGRLTESLELS